MSEPPHSPAEACPRCTVGALRLVAGRVTKLEAAGGYLDIFQCSSCGQIEHRDIPHNPPGKRT